MFHHSVCNVVTVHRSRSAWLKPVSGNNAGDIMAEHKWLE